MAEAAFVAVPCDVMITNELGDISVREGVKVTFVEAFYDDRSLVIIV